MFGKTGSIKKIECESTRGNQWIHSSITSHWVFRLVTLVAKKQCVAVSDRGMPGGWNGLAAAESVDAADISPVAAAPAGDGLLSG